MPKHNIISTRCPDQTQSGMSCGPVSNDTVVAEAVIEKDGKKLYLTAEWIDEVADMISYEVTEEPIADIMSDFATGDVDKLEQIRKTGTLYPSYELAMKSEYSEELQLLTNMVSDHLAAAGFFTDWIEEEEELPLWYSPSKN